MQFLFQQFFGWQFSKELSHTNAGFFETQQLDIFRGLVGTRGTLFWWMALFVHCTFCALLTGFGLPANVDTWQNLMLVPELKSCVTLLDETNEVVARLGQAVDRSNEIKDLRGQPDKWLDGQFVHPHDACFAPNGDIFVAEWVSTGRITKLQRV